jgi:transposase
LVLGFEELPFSFHPPRDSESHNSRDTNRADRSKGKTGLTTAEREELAKLRKEVRQLRMERDILKEAAVLFAQHRR